MINIAPLSDRNRLLIFLAVLIGLGITLYGKSLYALSVAVLQRQGSSHGLFVPFISAYLIWLKFDKIKEVTPQNALLPGGAMATVGGVLFILGRNGSGFSLPVLSFLLVAGGLILVLFGAVPLSIIGGMLRLSIIFTSAYYIGPIMVEHRPHVMLSWSVFTTLLVIVIAVDRYVSKKKVN